MADVGGLGGFGKTGRIVAQGVIIAHLDQQWRTRPCNPDTGLRLHRLKYAAFYGDVECPAAICQRLLHKARKFGFPFAFHVDAP